MLGEKWSETFLVGWMANGIEDMSKHSGLYCQVHYSEPENPSRIVLTITAN